MSLVEQLLQKLWPSAHCRIGGNIMFMQIAHSSRDLTALCSGVFRLEPTSVATRSDMGTEEEAVVASEAGAALEPDLADMLAAPARGHRINAAT